MGARDPRKIAAVPGRLVKDPTSLATTFPYGGTVLGTYRDVVFRPAPTYFEVIAEEYGSAVADVVYMGEAPFVACVLRHFDEEALAAYFPNLTSTGTVTKRKGVVGPSPDPAATVRAGASLSSRSLKLLFVPDDPDRNRALVIYKAIPRVAESVEVAFQFDRTQEVPVIFTGIPDATGRGYALHFLRDMTL